MFFLLFLVYTIMVDSYILKRNLSCDITHPFIVQRNQVFQLCLLIIALTQGWMVKAKDECCFFSVSW